MAMASTTSSSDPDLDAVASTTDMRFLGMRSTKFRTRASDRFEPSAAETESRDGLGDRESGVLREGKVARTGEGKVVTEGEGYWRGNDAAEDGVGGGGVKRGGTVWEEGNGAGEYVIDDLPIFTDDGCRERAGGVGP